MYVKKMASFRSLCFFTCSRFTERTLLVNISAQLIFIKLGSILDRASNQNRTWILNLFYLWYSIRNSWWIIILVYFLGRGGIKSLSGSLFWLIRFGALGFGFAMIFETAFLLFDKATIFERGAEPLVNISEPIVPRWRGEYSVSQSVMPNRYCSKIESSGLLLYFGL